MKRIIMKTVSYILCISILLSFSFLLSNEISNLNNYRYYNALCRDISKLQSFDGDIENRVIVISKNKINPLDSVEHFSGCDNKTFLQFKSKDQAEKAVQYYNSLDNTTAECDVAYTVDSYDDEDLLGFDAKTCESATNNLDDAKKLINKYVSDYSEIRVAVIDTGVDKNEITQGRIHYVNNSQENDPNGHGTKVAGTILLNTFDNVEIYTGSCGNEKGDISLGTAGVILRACVSNGCKVANLSFGGFNYSSSFSNDITYATNNGCLVFASSGNDSAKIISSKKYYPSCLSNVIGVANITSALQKNKTSNYGLGADISAVGSSVTTFYNNQLIYWSGTSAACPVAVSAACLALTANPDLSYTNLKEYVLNSYLPTVDDNIENYIDAYSLVERSLGKSLDQVKLDYDVFYEANKGEYAVKLKCNDNVRVYGNDSNLFYLSDCFNNPTNTTQRIYRNGDIIYHNALDAVRFTGYADDMRKSEPVTINLSSNNFTYSSIITKGLTSAPID